MGAEPGLRPSRHVPVDHALAGEPVEDALGRREGRAGVLGSGRLTDLLDGGAKTGAVVTVAVAPPPVLAGALLGGVLIGLTEALAGLLFTPSAKSMFSFGLLVLVLLFRPQGILGKRLA